MKKTSMKQILDKQATAFDKYITNLDNGYGLEVHIDDILDIMTCCVFNGIGVVVTPINKEECLIYKKEKSSVAV